MQRATASKYRQATDLADRKLDEIHVLFARKFSGAVESTSLDSPVEDLKLTQVRSQTSRSFLQ